MHILDCGVDKMKNEWTKKYAYEKISMYLGAKKMRDENRVTKKMRDEKLWDENLQTKKYAMKIRQTKIDSNMGEASENGFFEWKQKVRVAVRERAPQAISRWRLHFPFGIT